MDYPTPKNLNYWWTFGAHPRRHAGDPDRHRHHPRDALYARTSTMAFNSVEHIRRDVNGGRIIQAVHAVGASMFFCGGLHPHLPRSLLRLVQGAARDPLDPRRPHLPADDGDGLHGLRAAVGPDELLGRDGDHQHLRGDPDRRRRRSCSCCAAASRSTTRRSTASSRCTTCCRSSSRRWWCCTSGRCTCRATTTRSASR